MLYANLYMYNTSPGGNVVPLTPSLESFIGTWCFNSNDPSKVQSKLRYRSGG